MFRSQLVAEHLPLLRRYARALTGSQASGDAYVAARRVGTAPAAPHVEIDNRSGAPALDDQLRSALGPTLRPC